MTDKEAMKLALFALDIVKIHYTQSRHINEAIAALKERLAQRTEQEPAAIDWERIAKVQNAKLMAMCDEAGGFEKLCEVMNKYKSTHPPQRTEQEPKNFDLINESFEREEANQARVREFMRNH